MQSYKLNEEETDNLNRLHIYSEIEFGIKKTPTNPCAELDGFTE